MPFLEGTSQSFNVLRLTLIQPFHILVEYEGYLIVAIVFNVVFGNIKGLFLLDRWGNSFKNSTHVVFYVNTELWAKLTLPNKLVHFIDKYLRKEKII